MRRNASRRSRSRSRTPPVRAKPKTVVNMLDCSALSAAKEVRRKPIFERVTGGPKPPAIGGGAERITCTIEGSGERRSVYNRVSGGRFEGGGRFDGGNRSFDGGNRGGFQGNRGGFDGNRSFNGGDRRVNVGGEGMRRSFPERRSFPDRLQRDGDDEGFGRRRGGDDDKDGEKPMMKLVDPQEVPRSNRFFTHDDRGGDSHEWRGRDMYDPRKDTGRYDRGDRGRFDRDRRDYGNRRFDRSDDRDRRSGGGAAAAGGGGGWDGFARQNVNGYTGYSGSRFGERSGVDGVWVHDKFLDLTDDEEEKKEDKADDGVLVIDAIKTERTVEE